MAKLELLIPPPVIALLCGLGIWGFATLWPEFVFAFRWQVQTAIVLFMAGAALDVTSVLFFRKAGTTVTPLAPEKASQLVTKGPYRFTRNPMYLGILLILSGVTLALGSPLGIIFLAVFVAYITRFQMIPEERRLRENFSGEFEAYEARTRRWL